MHQNSEWSVEIFNLAALGYHVDFHLIVNVNFDLRINFLKKYKHGCIIYLQHEKNQEK